MASRQSVRSLLAAENVLIVHFSGTPRMTAQPGLFYPDDLKKVQNNGVSAVCCSTIHSSDEFNMFGKANAIGSVGLILDINSDNSVMAADRKDTGSYYDQKTGIRSVQTGMDTIQHCEDSILSRDSNEYNEWVVQDYSIIGLFVFPCPMAEMRGVCGNNGSVSLAANQIHPFFQTLKIYTVYNSGFLDISNVNMPLKVLHSNIYR